MDFRVQLVVRLRTPYVMPLREARRRWWGRWAASGEETTQTVTGYCVVSMARADDIVEALELAKKATLSPQEDLDWAAVDGEVEEAEIQKMDLADLRGDVLLSARKPSANGVYHATGPAFFAREKQQRTV